MSENKPKKRPPFPKELGLHVFTSAGYRKIPEALAGRYFELRHQLEVLEKECLPLLEDNSNTALRRFIDTSRSLGYVEALMHDDQTAEAQLILERMKAGPKRGAAATKKKAEPRRLAIRRRFKELRRDGHNKGKAREMIESEYAAQPGKKISFRQIERHTRGMS